ncbi:MAG: hypothetical protein WC412_08355 [Candidatus Omnitrophota bacterium]|jgi:hypothetical protein
MGKIEIPASRAAGKTRVTIEWLRQNEKAIMIASTEERKEELQAQYPDVANRIVTYKDYMFNK